MLAYAVRCRSGSRPIEAVGTSIAAFVGTGGGGPVNPTLTASQGRDAAPRERPSRTPNLSLSRAPEG
jgi:phage tail sheath protein FI